MRVNVYFRLFLEALHAGIEIDYITFEEGSADPDQNTAAAGPGHRQRAPAAGEGQPARRADGACFALDLARAAGRHSSASLGQDCAPRALLQPRIPRAIGACMQLFNIVSRHNQWLAVRQNAIAGNIANANTPGFRAQDVQPFEMAVEQARLAMAATQPGHLIVRSAGRARNGAAPRRALGGHPLRQQRQPGAGAAQGRRGQSRLPAQYQRREGVPPHDPDELERSTPWPIHC